MRCAAATAVSSSPPHPRAPPLTVATSAQEMERGAGLRPVKITVLTTAMWLPFWPPPPPPSADAAVVALVTAAVPVVPAAVR